MFVLLVVTTKMLAVKAATSVQPACLPYPYPAHLPCQSLPCLSLLLEVIILN
jgi:hypothetical protein